MNKSIYYGNIETHVLSQPASSQEISVQGSKIIFTGFDLTASASSSHKLDLLFYNRVNSIGEVLSSLVYISLPLSKSDVTEKVYDAKSLYANTVAERIMNVQQSFTDFTYLNCKWATSKFFTSSVSPLVDTETEVLVTNGDPSVKLNKYGVAVDGWYTQASVGVRTINVGNPPVGTPRKGLVGYHSFADLGPQLAILTENDPSNVYDDQNWSVYTYFLADGTTNPDDSVAIDGTSLANLLVTSSIDNPHIKQNFFVLPVYLDLYDTAVEQYANFPTYGNPYPTLRNKHRIIHEYASEVDFTEAQYVLQTTDFFRTTIQL